MPAARAAFPPTGRERCPEPRAVPAVAWGSAVLRTNSRAFQHHRSRIAARHSHRLGRVGTRRTHVRPTPGPPVARRCVAQAFNCERSGPLIPSRTQRCQETCASSPRVEAWACMAPGRRTASQPGRQRQSPLPTPPACRWDSADQNKTAFAAFAPPTDHITQPWVDKRIDWQPRSCRIIPGSRSNVSIMPALGDVRPHSRLEDGECRAPDRHSPATRPCCPVCHAQAVYETEPPHSSERRRVRPASRAERMARDRRVGRRGCAKKALRAFAQRGAAAQVELIEEVGR